MAAIKSPFCPDSDSAKCGRGRVTHMWALFVCVCVCAIQITFNYNQLKHIGVGRFRVSACHDMQITVAGKNLHMLPHVPRADFLCVCDEISLSNKPELIKTITRVAPLPSTRTHRQQ